MRTTISLGPGSGIGLSTVLNRAWHSSSMAATLPFSLATIVMMNAKIVLNAVCIEKEALATNSLLEGTCESNPFSHEVNDRGMISSKVSDYLRQCWSRPTRFMVGLHISRFYPAVIVERGDRDCRDFVKSLHDLCRSTTEKSIRLRRGGYDGINHMDNR